MTRHQIKLVDSKEFKALRSLFALHGCSLYRTAACDGPQRLFFEFRGDVRAMPSLQVASVVMEQLLLGRLQNPAIEGQKP